MENKVQKSTIVERQAAYQLGLCWSEAASALGRVLERRSVPADRRFLELGAQICRQLADELGQPTEEPLARRLLALLGPDQTRPQLADRLHRAARILQAATGAGPLEPGLRARASEVHEFLSNAYFLVLWDLAAPARQAVS